MTNTRQKMYRTNSKIRKYLVANGFTNIYSFPHSQFSKDYIVDNYGFDAIATKNFEFYLFQFKTNCKPSKKILEQYKRLSMFYNIHFQWINYKKGKVEVYG